jgi:hypothetical protein
LSHSETQKENEMNRRLLVFLLAGSLGAFAQGRPSGAGRPSGTGAAPTGVGQPSGVGRPSDAGGRPSDVGGKPSDVGRTSQTQQSLKDSQVNSGAFTMLEQKTGMTADQLKALYASSGAKNFGEFTSAIIVSKNLGLDTSQVLAGLKTQSLGQTLQSLGVAPKKAKSEIKKAQGEVKTSS